MSDHDLDDLPCFVPGRGWIRRGDMSELERLSDEADRLLARAERYGIDEDQ